MPRFAIRSILIIVAQLAWACEGQHVPTSRKDFTKVLLSSLSSAAASKQEMRVADETLQALATYFLSTGPVTAKSSSRTRALLPKRSPKRSQVALQHPRSTRSHAAEMAACPMAAVGTAATTADTAQAPATADAKAALVNAGQLAADWAVKQGKPKVSIAVSAATSTPAVLRDFWKQVRTYANEPGRFGRERVLVFPNWAEGIQTKEHFNAVMIHLHLCAEVTRYLGTAIVVEGRHPVPDVIDDDDDFTGIADEDPIRPPCPVFVLRAFIENDEDTEDHEFLKTEDLEKMPHYVRAVDETGVKTKWASDEEVLEETRKWVEAVIVQMKVCPFSSTADKAGIPQGGVTYPITHAEMPEEVYERFWEQVLLLRERDPHDLATVLLVTPRCFFFSPGGYDMLADTLNAAYDDPNLGFQDEFQLVFFHPEYNFRDGKERIGGQDSALNYARRSPYPMINLLRTPQVRNAQKGLPTGQVYLTNEDNLKSVGVGELQLMLEVKDWSSLHNRKYIKHTENLK